MKKRNRSRDERRTVTLCQTTRRSSGMRTGPSRLWAFGYDTLAELLDKNVNTVRHLVSKGQLDPSDLEAVCRAWAARQGLVRRDHDLIDGHLPPHRHDEFQGP